MSVGSIQGGHSTNFEAVVLSMIIALRDYGMLPVNKLCFAIPRRNILVKMCRRLSPKSVQT